MYVNKTTRPKPMILGKFQVEEIRFYPEEMALVVSSDNGYFSILLEPQRSMGSLFWFYKGSNVGRHLGTLVVEELVEFFEELLARSAMH